MPPMLPSERIAHLSKAGDCCAAGFQSGLGRFRVKMRRTRSEHILSALPPLTTEERTPESAAPCRLCCKSPKLPGDKILAIRRTNRRPPIYAASVTLPSSPASSSSGNEVPHIFTRKSRLQPGEFLVTSAKRLLQQYLPGAAVSRCSNTACYSITSSARASSGGGTSRPSALAVLRLIASSYLVGACTGRSAGFSPLRMRST